MITQQPVHWEAARVFPRASHILDFDLGGISELAVLTHRNKGSTGVRIMIAGAFQDIGNEVGYKPELFGRILITQSNAQLTGSRSMVLNWYRQGGEKSLSIQNFLGC